MNLHFKTFRTKHVPDDWEGNDYGTEDKHTEYTDKQRAHTQYTHTHILSQKHSTNTNTAYPDKNTQKTQTNSTRTSTNSKHNTQTYGLPGGRRPLDVDRVLGHDAHRVLALKGPG